MTYYFQKSTYRNTNIRRRIRIALLLVLFMPIIADIGGEKWSRRLRQFDALDGLNPPKLGGIVFTGSSSIEYWESLAEDFRSHYVLNRGVGGALIAHVTYFADRVIIPYQPRMIVLYCGENDLYIGRTADQVLADLDALIDFTLGTHPITTKGTSGFGRSEATKRFGCLFTLNLPSFSNWAFSPRVFLDRISLLSK
jgi:hypothetical protein